MKYCDKTTLPTRKIARHLKRPIQRKFRLKLYIYYCHVCDGYHYTSLSRDVYRQICQRHVS